MELATSATSLALVGFGPVEAIVVAIFLVIPLAAAWLFACPVIAYRMAMRKGRNAWGCAAIGFVFGLLGILFVMLLSDSTEMRLEKERAFRNQAE